MRFTVTTPLRVVIDAKDVRSLRAEDETGSFGVLPGHADFLTVLTISVVTWRNSEDREEHVAVRGGTLIVRQDQHVEVVTRDAVSEETLGALSEAVVQHWRKEKKVENEAGLSASRLQLAAIHLIERYVEAGCGGHPREPVPVMSKAISVAAAAAGDDVS